MPGWAWPLPGGLPLIWLYLARYLSFPSLPGINPAAPDGWWHWIDQGQ